MDGGAHGVAKSRTRLSDFTSGQTSEKAMATHSSVLAWRIPGTEEPGGLPSPGSQSQTRLKRLGSSSGRADLLGLQSGELWPPEGARKALSMGRWD